MKTIHRLRAAGRLTETQLLTAFRFYRNPNTFHMAPSTFRILREMIIDEVPLEQLEEQRGWSARSAKVVLSVLLHAIEEVEGDFWPIDSGTDDAEMAQVAEYFVNGDQTEVMRLQTALGLSKYEARVLRLLLINFGSPVSYDAIFEACYFDGEPSGDAYMAVKVRISKIRQRIAKLDLKIRCMQRSGYILYSIAEGADMSADLYAMISQDDHAGPARGKAAP